MSLTGENGRELFPERKNVCPSGGLIKLARGETGTA